MLKHMDHNKKLVSLNIAMYKIWSSFNNFFVCFIEVYTNYVSTHTHNIELCL